MIVVDTSAFVEFYRPSGIATAQEAVAAAVRADEVAVNGVIQVELVPFATTPGDRARIRVDLQAFHWLDLGNAEFERAVTLGSALRSQGLTVPATDLIIAASALEAGAELYHLDAHYDWIAQHSALRARNLGR